MNSMTRKVVLLTAILTFCSCVNAGKQLLSDQAIYQHLFTVAHGQFKKYDGITYAAPSYNSLSFIQTPNIWGLDISTYNKGFTPLAGNKTDPKFNMPTCNTNADCQGYSTCQAPDFTTDLNGNRQKLCTTSADKILSTIYETIIHAKRSVDLTTLQPMNKKQSSFSTDAFTATIQHAIAVLAQKSVNYAHPIQIRFIQGSFLPYTVNSSSNAQAAQSQQNAIQFQTTYLKNLTSSLPKNNKLIISLGSMRSCVLGHNCGNEDKQHDLMLDFAFNHGKIIDVDNSILITGGHNLWGKDYLQTTPVNDLSVMVQGPVAKNATIYANQLWGYLCGHHFHDISNFYVTYQNGQIISHPKSCPATIDPSSSIEKNIFSSQFDHVSVMPVSKLNNGVGLGDDADQSEPARVFAFEQAQHNIKISQQAFFEQGVGTITHRHPMLHPLDSIDGTVMQALAGAIMRNVQVYIVTSSDVAGGSYSSYYPVLEVYNYLLTLLVNSGVNAATAKQKLQMSLHLATISYANGEQDNIYSHDKFWMVDDKVFYVGSHNFYPSALQQFGVIVDNTQAAAYINATLWQPLWDNAVVERD